MMVNSSHNLKKLKFAYLLTSGRMKSKAKITAHFLERKAVDYAKLKGDVEMHNKHEKYIKRLGRVEMKKMAGQCPMPILMP